MHTHKCFCAAAKWFPGAPGTVVDRDFQVPTTFLRSIQITVPECESCGRELDRQSIYHVLPKSKVRARVPISNPRIGDSATGRIPMVWSSGVQLQSAVRHWPSHCLPYYDPYFMLVFLSTRTGCTPKHGAKAKSGADQKKQLLIENGHH